MLGLHSGILCWLETGCPLRDVVTVFFFFFFGGRIWDDEDFSGFTPWKINTLNLKMEVDG